MPKSRWQTAHAGCPATITAQREEIERLRAALERIANTIPDAICRSNCLGSEAVIEIARAALSRPAEDGARGGER